MDNSPARTLVIHPYRPSAQLKRKPAAALEEAVGLTQAITLEVIHAETVALKRTHPSTLIGKGKIAELRHIAKDEDAAVVIVNHTLSPTQQRNLEKELECKVIDRTALILEIFGERARTREGQLQVELAAMEYQKSRLVRSWTHLERQRGGAGFMGGPGEKQIETDRRILRERIASLKKQLADVVRTRELHRKQRRDIPYPTVALTGYTNAGKSTLFNRLTQANVQAQDQLFATLDPTIRALTLPSGLTVLLSDTVGFISDLPTELIAAFRATLEEVLGADLIVHVRDGSHADTDAQKEDVEAVLASLFKGHEMPSIIEVMNKIDLINISRTDSEFHAPTSPAEDNTDFLSPNFLSPKGGVAPQATRGVPTIVSEKIHGYAKDLRQNITDAEAILWSVLRKKQLEGFHFRRRVPIGNYIVDFACLKQKLIIELDGAQHNEDNNECYDDKRSEDLRMQGYSVLRFLNKDVIDNLHGVIEGIYYHLTLYPPPSARSAEFSPLQRGEKESSSYRKSNALLEREEETAISLSAITGKGVNALLSAIDTTISSHLYQSYQLEMPASEGKKIAWLHRHGNVMKESYKDDNACIEVQLSSTDYARWLRL